MIRAVFDTNVIVSALLQSLGPSSRLLLRCFDGLIQLCVSGSVYAEYEDVLRGPRLARDTEIIAGTLQTIRQTGFWFGHSSEFAYVRIPMTTSFWSVPRRRKLFIW